MDPFAAALDALFNAPGSAAAVYVSATTGIPSSIRVVERQVLDGGVSITPSTRVVGNVYDVRIADVADPRPGDALVVDGRNFVLVTKPDHDVERLTWHIEAPIAPRSITVLRYGKAANGFGDMTAGYAPSAPLPVSFWPIRGIEVGSGVEIASRSSMRFLIAWSVEVGDLNPKDRVQYDGRIYDIDAVKEVGDRVGIEITASARDDQ